MKKLSQRPTAKKKKSEKMLCSKKSRTETLPSREFNRKIVKIEKKKKKTTNQACPWTTTEREPGRETRV